MTKHTRNLTVGIVSILTIFLLAGVLVALQLSAQFASPDRLQTITSKSALQAPGFATEEAARDAAPLGMGEFDDSAMILPSEPPTPFPPTAGQTAADVEQRIIKNGFLALIVNSVNETSDRISAYANEIGGFVQSSSVSEREDGTHVGSTTVRVPVDRFEEAMNQLKTFANVVQTERITGQDVTEQYTDLEARLRNARAQEETYLGLLDQATDVEDILAIQRELSNVRSQIEFLTGRLQALENQTAFSTININLSEETRVQAPTKEFRPIASVREAAQTLVGLAQQGVVAIIWIVVIGGGLLIPLALIGWIIYKLAQMGKKRSE